jgi:hypothetical protein
MDRPGTCIIILDKKYNIANSSCHFGSYGSIWIRSFGPYNILLVTDRSIYYHMTLSAMNYLLYISSGESYSERIWKLSGVWPIHLEYYKIRASKSAEFGRQMEITFLSLNCSYILILVIFLWEDRTWLVETVLFTNCRTSTLPQCMIQRFINKQ